MNTSYIYSASRVQALGQTLLTEADVERLLAAPTAGERFRALHESYLAPYLDQDDMPAAMTALDRHLQEVKRVVLGIAPEARPLSVLWLKYDFHNLRIFMRGKLERLSYEATTALFSGQSYYPADQFYEYAVANTLNRLEPELHEAYHEAYRYLEARDGAAADRIVDAAYFACVRRIVGGTTDSFLRQHVAGRIDLFNLTSRLRTLAHNHVDFDRVFVSGGTIRRDQIEILEQTLAAFAELGGESFWRAALTEYQDTGHSTRIDARADDYLLQQAVTTSVDIFSSASLVAYVLKAREAAATVRAVLVGTASGLPAHTIRHNLRPTYVTTP